MFKDAGFLLQRYAVLFHPVLDQLNGGETLGYNWKNGTIYEINRFGYQILKIIDNRPGITPTELLAEVAILQNKQPWQIEKKVERFTQKMLAQNIVSMV